MSDEISAENRNLSKAWSEDDPREYQRLVEEARSLGIPTELDDPDSPRTVAGLRDAVARARAMSRTILVHLNIEIPVDSPWGADKVARELLDALDIGIDREETPALWNSHPVVALAEEV